MVEKKHWRDMPLEDLLAADGLSPKRLVELIVEDLYTGLRAYCDFPDLYAQARLGYEQVNIDRMGEDELQQLLENPPGNILDPEKVQVKAVEFCRAILSGADNVCIGRNPFSPKFGAAFVGPPGTGKTHIMAAFGREIKTVLDDKLQSARTLLEAEAKKITAAVRRGYAEKHAAMKTVSVTAAKLNMEQVRGKGLMSAALELEDSVVAELPSREQLFTGMIDELLRKLRSWRYLPTDVLFMTFDEFFELYRRESERSAVLEGIVKAKLLFVDDLHDKGDPQRREAIQHLIERRYEERRFGTFFTTNLQTDAMSGGDKSIADRLSSRCSASMLLFDFTGCKDWRTKVQHRRVNLVEQRLDELGEGIIRRLRGEIAPDEPVH